MHWDNEMDNKEKSKVKKKKTACKCINVYFDLHLSIYLILSQSFLIHRLKVQLTCKISWLIAASIVIAGSGGGAWVLSLVTCSESSSSCWITSVTPSVPSVPPPVWPGSPPSCRTQEASGDLMSAPDEYIPGHRVVAWWWLCVCTWVLGDSSISIREMCILLMWAFRLPSFL